MNLRAKVENGRLILDEPTTLPNGTIVDLVVDDEGDDLSEEDRQALHDAIERSLDSAERGNTRPASATITDLRGGR